MLNLIVFREYLDFIIIKKLIYALEYLIDIDLICPF